MFFLAKHPNSSQHHLVAVLGDIILEIFVTKKYSLRVHDHENYENIF